LQEIRHLHPGLLRAILPLFYTKGLPLKVGRRANGRRLSSLPRTPVAGPLALDDGAMATVLGYAVEFVRAEPPHELEIKTREDGLSNLVPEPPVCGPCEECRRLRLGNAKRQHRVNWAVSKALRLGLQVGEAETEAEVAPWYPLYLDAMRQHAFPPRSYRFFADLLVDA